MQRDTLIETMSIKWNFSRQVGYFFLSIWRRISYIRDSNKGYDKRALESKEREKVIWTNWPVRDANV